MTDFPRELIRPARPMAKRPEPPAPGVPRQILWYHVEEIAGAYIVRNTEGDTLTSSDDWETLCHECGWFPKEGAALSATIAVPTARVRIPLPRKLEHPLPERPTPPAVGETKQIGGYAITAKICKGANGDRPIYYLRNDEGELLSASYDVHFEIWCHTLGWYPMDGIAIGEPIPRELPVTVAKPPRPTGPHVCNRHHYKSREEIPEPWLYVGRGTPLGNPYTVDEHGLERAMNGYREWLWKRIVHRDPGVLAELGKITAEIHLVCSCAPRPCHANTIVKAWKWAKGRSVLDGYRKAEGEADPDWATETEPPVIEKREEPETLDLFGGEP